MQISLLTVLMVGVIFMVALITALTAVVLSVYRSRSKGKGSTPTQSNDLDGSQAAEIVSTWNVMHSS